MALPIADWQAALNEMEKSIGHTLAALDRYQSEWGDVLSSPIPAALLPVGDLGRVEERLREWDARLSAAAELAESVSKQLDDREAAVGRWREVFTDWQEVIKQGVNGV